MSQDERMIAACLEAPADADRLRVYADWLEERGDARAAYARAQLDHRLDPDPARLPGLRRLYPAHEPVWTGRFELAGVFEQRLVDVPPLWWGVGIRGRSTSSTYQGFDHAAQPSIPFDRFDGSFRWLREALVTYPSFTPVGPGDAAWAERLGALRAAGFHVPVALEVFLADPVLHRAVPSCTDNHVMSAQTAVEQPLPDGDLFLTFYQDSQYCVVWGIRLGRGDDVYAPILAGPPEFPEDEGPDPSPRFPDLSFSAPTLESFLYRWWIENRIWFATTFRDGPPMTPEEQAYLAHFAAGDRS